VSDFGLDDWATGVRSPAGAKDFSSSLCIQTGSEAHPASCKWVPGVLSPGLKRGRGVTLTTHPHQVPRSWMSRSYTSSPPIATRACSGTAFRLLCVKWSEVRTIYIAHKAVTRGEMRQLLESGFVVYAFHKPFAVKWYCLNTRGSVHTMPALYGKRSLGVEIHWLYFCDNHFQCTVLPKISNWAQLYGRIGWNSTYNVYVFHLCGPEFDAHRIVNVHASETNVQDLLSYRIIELIGCVAIQYMSLAT
jgi:hypothetical protein